MNRFHQWFRNKLGRIVSSVGLLLSGVETFDISPIKDPLEGFIGHKGVMGITVALFLASYVRHQFVANKHPAATVLPPPTPESGR